MYMTRMRAIAMRYSQSDVHIVSLFIYVMGWDVLLIYGCVFAACDMFSLSDSIAIGASGFLHANAAETVAILFSGVVVDDLRC